MSGTNSFAASELKQFNAWDGMALGMGIGGIEMLVYVLVFLRLQISDFIIMKAKTDIENGNLKPSYTFIYVRCHTVKCLGLGILYCTMMLDRESHFQIE